MVKEYGAFVVLCDSCFLSLHVKECNFGRKLCMPSYPPQVRGHICVPDFAIYNHHRIQVYI
jgi:hypothetical protein